jgi:hypothetical protein
MSDDENDEGEHGRALEPRGALDAIKSGVRRHAGILKPVGYGILFATGALVTARIVGPRVASSVGEAGGEGFARGVAAAQEAISGRRSRWG